MKIDLLKLQTAVDFTVANETSWSRDIDDNWGIYLLDPPPFNRLLGPVHPRGGVSGVVRIGGKQVIEWGEPQRADLTFSIAKTYLALLAGVAHDRGLLPDLDEPVHIKAPGIGFEGAHNQSVTWLQLLQQTSEWEGTCFEIPDTIDRYRHLQYQPPRTDPKDVGKKGDPRPLHAPGTYWEYNDVRINQLGLALLHLFKRPLPEVFRETIAQPCGLSDSWHWEGYDNSWVEINGQRMQSVPGGTHWGAGLSISSADQALVGQMMLNQGRVGNKQVVSEDWIRRMSTPSAIAPWYGMLVWLNRLRGVCPNASPESYFCIGAGASVVWIDPTRDMVAVVRWIDGGKIDGFCKLMGEAVSVV